MNSGQRLSESRDQSHPFQAPLTPERLAIRTAIYVTWRRSGSRMASSLIHPNDFPSALLSAAMLLIDGELLDRTAMIGNPQRNAGALRGCFVSAICAEIALSLE